MKKTILIAALFLFVGLNGLVAQKSQNYSIPCYDIKLSQPTTEFLERKPITPPKEKREMEIVISSSSTSPFDVFATVWLVKKQGNVVKGPYTIYLDQPFTRTIDTDQWGVVMTCGFENIKTSIWTQ